MLKGFCSQLKVLNLFTYTTRIVHVSYTQIMALHFVTSYLVMLNNT